MQSQTNTAHILKTLFSRGVGRGRGRGCGVTRDEGVTEKEKDKPCEMLFPHLISASPHQSCWSGVAWALRPVHPGGPEPLCGHGHGAVTLCNSSGVDKQDNCWFPLWALCAPGYVDSNLVVISTKKPAELMNSEKVSNRTAQLSVSRSNCHKQN